MFPYVLVRGTGYHFQQLLPNGYSKCTDDSGLTATTLIGIPHNFSGMAA